MDNQMLEQALQGEPHDFVVYSAHNKPLKEGLGLLAFGLFWLGFTSLATFTLFSPLLYGEEVHFTSNGQPVVASLADWHELVTPGLFLGLFLLIGIGVLIAAMVTIFAPGGWVVGTPKALVFFRKGKFRAIDWEQFNGDLQVSGNEQKGTLTLVMRTGRMVSQKHGERYVPEKMYIVGVPGIFAIERICRQRIKENDPTPAVTG